MIAAFDILRDPKNKKKLAHNGDFLSAEEGDQFSIDGKFINFLDGQAHSNETTEKEASFRWEHSARLEGDEEFIKHQLNDFLKRYGFKNEQDFSKYLENVETIAEIGAGEGRLVDWFLKFSDATIYALEISDSTKYLQEKYEDTDRVIIIKADALYHPFAEGSIDLLSCEQSIHHTDQPGKIFDSLAQSLSPEGKVLLSVYTEKSPIREKFDKIIREGIAELSSEEKYEVAKKITDIGKILSELKVDVTVPEDYTEFGNLKGKKMSLQRFMYYAVMKCFWNDDFTYDKCVEFNHDWYSYPICNTVSPSEVKSWFKTNKIEIDHVDANNSNVNIRGSAK